MVSKDFPGGSRVKNPPADARDTGSTLDPGRSDMLWSNGDREPPLLSLWSGTQEPGPPKPERPRTHAPNQEKPPQSEA